MIFLLVDTAAMALLFGTGNRTFILFLDRTLSFLSPHLAQRTAIRRLLEVLLRLSSHNRYPPYSSSLVSDCGLPLLQLSYSAFSI